MPDDRADATPAPDPQAHHATGPDATGPDGTGLNRRSALAAIVGLGGALVGAMAGLAGGFLANALGRKRRHDWIRVGSAEDLDSENFQKLVLSEDHQHAWVQERKALVVYIKDYYPEDPVALHARCSHLGCSVNWEADESRFLCPCHGGAYDEGGAVLEGPPPTALTRLEVKIEDDILFVRMPSAENEA